MSVALLYGVVTAWALLWLLWLRRARAPAGADVERHDRAFMSAGDGGEGGAPRGGRALVVAFIQRPSTRDTIRGWIVRLGVPRRDVDDLAQDVLLQAIRSADTFDPARGSPERWCNSITVHVASRYRAKAHHRREELAADPPEHAGEGAGFDVALEAEEDRLGLLAALAELPEGGVVVAHDIDGEAMATIAARRGMPKSTLYKWRDRALAALALVLRPMRG